MAKKSKSAQRKTTRIDIDTHDTLRRESERTGIPIMRLIANAVAGMFGGANKTKKR